MYHLNTDEMIEYESMKTPYIENMLKFALKKKIYIEELNKKINGYYLNISRYCMADNGLCI